MKRCSTLTEMIDYLLKKHRSLRSMTKGVYGFKILRKPSGKRIPFEEIRGFRLFDFQVFNETTLIIDQMSVGMAFKGNKTIQQHARLFLPDLAVINAYDHRAEFFSTDSIDFSYIENDDNVHIEMLAEWIHDDPGIMRAQWISPNANIESLLDEISVGRKVKDPRRLREVDMDFDEF